MAKSSFGMQLRSLVKRNLLIKLRNRSQTAMEFIWPIFFICLLAIIKQLSTPDIDTSAVYEFPERALRYGKGSDVAPLILVAPVAALPMMTQVLQHLQPHYNTSKKLVPFENAEAMEQWFSDQGDDAFGVFAGVVFNSDDFQSYEIRTLYSKSAPTDSLLGLEKHCREGSEECPTETYLTNGFLELQTLVDSVILSKYGIAASHYSTQMMPKEKFAGDSTAIRAFAPLFYVYTYSFFIQFLLVNLVTEKKEKVKETMRIMGMKDSAFWLSWILVYSVIIVFISAFAVLMAHVTGFFSAISNMLIFFILLILYGLSVINLAFVMVPFFNNPKIAGPIASMSTTAIGIAFYAISLSTTYDEDGKPHSPVPAAVQWLLCLFSPIAFALGIERGLYLDISRLGITWENLWLGHDQDDALPMSAHLIMLAVDIVLYFALAVYLDSVIPGEFGTSKHPLFCFTPSYWCTKQKSQQEMDDLIKDYQTFGEQTADVEEVSDDLLSKDAVRLFDLRKTYKDSGKDINAVQGISLDMYEGQITCLLGHNGAGKTTIMNMLTGLIPPSHGTVTIYGLDITDSNAMTHIREMTGVCPQQNVLINELTVREHLQLFAGLKGVASEKIDSEIDQTLKDVDLDMKADALAKDLSGGQKRKLCVGIALIGDPKIIFLDEPSAGMDPYSRRHLWSLLKEKKKGKIILLTTHFMDEADLLSDRKAIVSKGKLRCCGSSIYLKTKFGAGYHLNFVVDSQTFVTDRVTSMIRQHIPDAEITHQHAAEISYTLPYKDVSLFAELFNKIGDNTGASSQQKSYGILSYGISMTTLEEVFLKLGVEEEEDQEQTILKEAAVLREGTNGNEAYEASTSAILTPYSHPTLFTGKDLTKRQFVKLVQLRFKQIIRNKGAWFGRFMFPVMLIVAGMAVIKFSKGAASGGSAPALSVTAANLIKPPIHPVAIVNATTDDISPLISYISKQWDGGVDVYDTDTNLLDVKVHEIAYKISSYSTKPSSGLMCNVTLQYNSSWIHSLPLLVNAMGNSLLRSLHNGSIEQPLINTSIHPFKSITPLPEFPGGIFAFSLIIGFAVVFIPASFAASVVKDRECKARSQLRISGVSSEIYWASIWLVDLLQGFLLGVIVMVLLLAFQIPSLVTNGALICSTIFFILYIPLYMCIAYTLSYMLDKYEMATTILPTIFLMMYMIPYMTVAIMTFLPSEGIRELAKYSHYLMVAVNPIYTVSGFFFMVNKLYVIESFRQQDLTPDVTLQMYLEWDNLITVCFIPPVFWYVVLAVAMRVAEILKYGGNIRELLCVKSVTAADPFNDDIISNEDSDVAEERRYVDSLAKKTFQNESAPVIVVQNLRKEFQTDRKMCTKDSPPLIAVRNNTFRVQPGEVFGLLGPNGAGKSTTLNMLTAEAGPTAGTVKVGDINVHSTLSEAYKMMGYCPQYDALWEGITLREHIEIYGTLRGFSQVAINRLADSYIKDLCLQDHADKKANKLSGGTKRKLSFIISMLGDPKVVLLDEPSTGMDPHSKRVFWDTISKSFVGTDRGAILTTHYMEEADALCSRIAIMVNGTIECMGTGQHLKGKFGKGYLLELKYLSNTADSDIDAGVTQIFPTAVCLERFADRVVYRVDQSDVKSLGKAFAQIESAKSSLGILDYSFSQATLEQVFLEFAKHQQSEDNKTDTTDEVALVRQKLSAPECSTKSANPTIIAGLMDNPHDEVTDRMKPPVNISYAGLTPVGMPLDEMIPSEELVVISRESRI